MYWSKTFVFPQVVNAVDFVHQFDEKNLGVRSWSENEVRVTIDCENEQDAHAKMAAVDKIGQEAGADDKGGQDGKWRDTDR